MTMIYRHASGDIRIPAHLTPQATSLLMRLFKTESITQREALIDHGIQSLTKRISELRGAGFKIKTETKRHPMTNQRYARYYLVKGTV